MRGLIPSIRFEVDETTVFDPDYDDAPFGSMIRRGSLMSITCRRDQSIHQRAAVTLVEGLPSTDDLAAGFRDWQIVLGDGPDKQILWRCKAINPDQAR
jgi:hypothetical protein